MPNPNPDIEALRDEWSPRDIIDFDSLTKGTTKKAKWTCPGCGWDYLATPSEKLRGRGCPYCLYGKRPGASIRKVKPGFNDLGTKYPHLAKEWSPKNTLSPFEVLPGSNVKVLWTCNKGLDHDYLASPEKRTRSSSSPTACSVCSGKIILRGFNDLASNYPELVREWSPLNTKKPDEVHYGAHASYIWVCSVNTAHTWKVSPKSRIASKSGCPVCSNRKDRDAVKILKEHNPTIVNEWIGSSSGDFRIKGKSDWKCSVCSFEWSAQFDNRMRGSGCPRCAKAVSVGELELLEFIKSLGYDTAHNDRTTIPPKELDILVPSKNIAIEFNGVYWHSDIYRPDKKYHRDKWVECYNAGFQLLTIWQDEWENSKDIVMSMIRNKLGVSTKERIAARDTYVSIESKKEAQSFLSSNHIQGFVGGTYYLGLRDKKSDALVSMATLKRLKNTLTLSRYATSCSVPGGHSKIISWVQKNLEFDKIVTFADLCVSDGSLYEKTGWTRDKELDPDYKYVVGSQRVHKFNYRLKRFRDDPELIFEEGLTERQLAELNRIPRIWDCGKIRYIMEKIK